MYYTFACKWLKHTIRLIIWTSTILSIQLPVCSSDFAVRSSLLKRSRAWRVRACLGRCAAQSRSSTVFFYSFLSFLNLEDRLKTAKLVWCKNFEYRSSKYLHTCLNSHKAKSQSAFFKEKCFRKCFFYYEFLKKKSFLTILYQCCCQTFDNFDDLYKRSMLDYWNWIAFDLLKKMFFQNNVGVLLAKIDNFHLYPLFLFWCIYSFVFCAL